MVIARYRIHTPRFDGTKGYRLRVEVRLAHPLTKFKIEWKSSANQEKEFDFALKEKKRHPRETNIHSSNKLKQKLEKAKGEREKLSFL